METFEEKKQPMIKYAATYGLIVGLALILLSTISYVSGSYGQNSILSFLEYVVVIAGIVYFTIMYRNKALGGYIAYGQALGFGIVLTMFAWIVYGAFSVILQLADPVYAEKLLELSANQLLQAGLSDSMVEQQMAMMRKMSNPFFMMAISVFTGALIGTIISLITSIFTKREKSIF